MPDYMLLCYHDEDETKQPHRDQELPALLELHEELRAQGLLLDVQCLLPTETATSVRVRDGEAEITDGPFAVTKERLAGYYIVRAGDLDEVLRLVRELPSARYGTMEVRPVGSLEERARAVTERAATT